MLESRDESVEETDLAGGGETGGIEERLYDDAVGEGRRRRHEVVDVRGLRELAELDGVLDMHAQRLTPFLVADGLPLGQVGVTERAIPRTHPHPVHRHRLGRDRQDVQQGGVLYRRFDVPQGACEICVWLAPEVRGRGLITRAFRMLIDWALDVRRLTRVEWLCDPRNEPSIATAKRLGFTHEGTHRKAFNVNGEYRDVQVWAIVR